MSDQSNERYVDPNSGAAPQPGGFASPAHPQAEQLQEAAQQGGEERDATYDASVEHEAAPAGPQPGAGDAVPSGDNEGQVGEPVEGAAGAEPTEGQTEGQGEEQQQDYAAFLDENSVDEVEDYVREHPDEKDAIIAAEREREKPRKGVLEL